MENKPPPGKYSVALYAQHFKCSKQNILAKIGRKTLPAWVSVEMVGTTYVLTVN